MTLLTAILVAIFLAIATEAITEIIVDSEFFAPLRNWWKGITFPSDKPPPDNFAQRGRVWFDKLISCGYCTSVWVAGLAATQAIRLFGEGLEATLANWVIMTFVIHRLATWFHVSWKLQYHLNQLTIAKVNLLGSPNEFRSGESTSEGVTTTQPEDL